MNIILLSGGSGSRLWPLSNDVRSKQFIPFFKTNGHQFESMLQRVYRQIKSADKSAHVTITTNKSQVSVIKKQLGDEVSICVEPSRRDTFAAISLACEYLSKFKGLSDEESIVVCPVDPYVDQSYFQMISHIDLLVQEQAADLTLLGIVPTYPSQKYGYIIPETSKQVSLVSSFKEKPDVTTAKHFIKQGALWNAGVFAFKLGYIRSILRDMYNLDSYDELLSQYANVEKKSFDYVVVENANRVQVERYAGAWSDVGTWNTLTDVMPDNVKGNVTLDEESTNTHIINELDIPILGMGLSNLVVVASEDGILVSDKERSGYMKPYAEKLKAEARYVEKSWGTYKVVDRTSNSSTVNLVMNAATKMSYHSHAQRDEIVIVVSGTGRIVIEGSERVVQKGQTVTFHRNVKHQIKADTELKLIEIQIGEHISSDDKTIYRL